MSRPVNEELQCRYELEGRGRGARERYIPWLQVERTGRQSRGRTHFFFSPTVGRHHHLFTDLQLRALIPILATSPVDCREHFPLAPDHLEPEFLLHRAAVTATQAAEAVGLPHPRHRSGRSKVLITTFYVTWSKRRFAFDIVGARAGEARREPSCAPIKRAYWTSREVEYRVVALPIAKRPNEHTWMQWALDGLRCTLLPGEHLDFIQLLGKTDRRLPMNERLERCANAACMPVIDAVLGLKSAILQEIWHPHDQDRPDLTLIWQGRCVPRAPRTADWLAEALR